MEDYEKKVDFTIDSYYNFSGICGGPIAQLVEPPAHNRQVVGSNPTRPTNTLLLLSYHGALAQLVERHPHTVEVTGSSPVRPTIPI